ncbi:MAG: endonuclease/exonuclease/phosphatase family protein [Alphaproteobacteria bacterium]|nr:endonuclease/exonuclease/phosphatase family protein [Alphaproteobacteria bacterium]
MSFVVCSYNILANAYIEPRYFPHVAIEHLRPEWRMGALADAIVRMAAQIICLQEIEEESFTLLRHRLGPTGYDGTFLKKAGERRDGCAMFFDQSLFSLQEVQRVTYDDGVEGQPASGNVALLLRLRHGKRSLGIATTHLKWQALTTPHELRIGLRQARQLVAELMPADAWIVSGDFNATADTLTLDAFWKAGFSDAYASRPNDYTCNSNEIAKRIDYLLHRGPLGAVPHALPAIHSTTPLPSLEQPSDHLAIRATFEWL